MAGVMYQKAQGSDGGDVSSEEDPSGVFPLELEDGSISDEDGEDDGSVKGMY